MIPSPVQADEVFGTHNLFNFFLSEAEDVYTEALRVARSVQAHAMEGKVLTNLSEVLCWSSPERALAFSKEAVELNETVSAPIEVGKAYAAQAIAFARMNELQQALTGAEVSIAIHEKCGYAAGKCSDFKLWE